MASTPVLLLSGAGLPDWVWDDVRARLSGTASEVAQRPGDDRASLAAYADAAARHAPWPTFAVVAHSIGGTVAAELLARHAGRVRAVLGVAAVVPRGGRCFVGCAPLPQRLVLGGVVRVLGTRPPERALRGQAAGLPSTVGDRLVAEFAPESRRLYLDAVSCWQPPPVTGYLRTTRDREVSTGPQDRSAAVLRTQWTQDLSTGHLPMLQAPEVVSAGVRRLLTDLDG